METFSALLDLCAGNSPVTGEFPSQRPVFSLISAWLSAWVNNREVGDLRRHRAHYDVIVMRTITPMSVRQAWRIWVNMSHKTYKTWYNHNKTKHNRVHILWEISYVTTHQLCSRLRFALLLLLLFIVYSLHFTHIPQDGFTGISGYPHCLCRKPKGYG